VNFELSGLSFFLHWLVAGLAVLLTSKIITGFEVRGFIAAMVSALVIGVVNLLLWPLFMFLTLPVNLLTLGLFTFVVNGAILKISAAILPGFNINGWLAAIFGSMVLSLLNLLLHYVFI
jgi:putative membrane protein